MPSSGELIGLGMPPKLSGLVGNLPSAKTGVGTAQVGATPITTNFTVVTASGGATAFVMSASVAGGGPFVIYNPSGTSALIYPGASNTFNGGSADAALTLPTLRSLLIFRTSATNWVAFFNATS